MQALKEIKDAISLVTAKHPPIFHFKFSRPINTKR